MNLPSSILPKFERKPAKRATGERSGIVPEVEKPRTTERIIFEEIIRVRRVIVERAA